MSNKNLTQTLDEKVNTEERARNNFAWHEKTEGGVRGLLYSAERVIELAGKKHKKNYWKIGALVSGIAVFTAVATTSILFLTSTDEREGWSKIEPPVEQISNIEQYKGKVIKGLTLREVREKINSALESFCERGYVGNGDGLFCDAGITPSLNNLLDVVGIINNDSISSSSVTLTFDERVIKYDESIQGKVIIVGGKDDYTLTDFSQHVLDNEPNFVWWIKKEYDIKIDYGKLKDLALVMAFSSLTLQKTEGDEKDEGYYLIDDSTLPKIIFRLVYNDDSKQDIKLDKRVGSCMSKEELIVQCKKYNIELKYCEEDYWKSFTALEKMACRLQKKIARDVNKHGDIEYELELVRWTTERREHVFTGKTTLAEEERIDDIHKLANLLRTYIYNNILNLHDDIIMYDIRVSTDNPEMVSIMYSIAHSYLDGVDDSEKDRETVSAIFKHIEKVLPYLRTNNLIKSYLGFFSKLKNQTEIEELFGYLEKIIMCVQVFDTEIEKNVELFKVYQALEPYINTPLLETTLGELTEKTCHPTGGTAW
ncbi:hypothetical protein J4434_01095 [Candidatus Woesearchaeota archaeon]|nr:hypothetical protein [Candidatus Woesearchaeota archaeon]